MSIISPGELASYLDVPITASLTMKVTLANGLVTDLIYADGVPSPIPSRVKAIALEAAARPVRNPDGYSSETVDDYTYRRDADTRAAGVYLTADEREELLGSVATRPRGGFYTVQLANPLDLQ